jgi:hypothetical protein
MVLAGLAGGPFALPAAFQLLALPMFREQLRMPGAAQPVQPG